MNRRRSISFVWVVCGVAWLAAAPVRAQDKPAGGAGAWSDAAEFGYVATAGNAQSTTLGFKKTLGRKWERSSFELKTGGVRVSATTTTRTAVGPGPATFVVIEEKDTALSAENYFLNGRYDRTISGRAFWFAGGGWTRNRFAGVQNRYEAAGGIGTALLELGHVAGLQMYGTASRPKHGLVARLGATPIDYRTEDFVGRVAAFTGGVGVDAVFDPMGSAHLKRSVKTVRKGGSVVAYGFYETANRGGNVVLDVLSQYLRLALWSLPPQRKHVAFYDIRPQKKKRPDWFREDLTALLGSLAAGTLRPVIAKRLPLEDVVKAHQQVEHAEVHGKLVLIPNP